MTSVTGAWPVSRFCLCLAPLLLPFLTGCNETYSPELRYPVRVDPIPTSTFTFESPRPDRPGNLPIMRPGQFDLLVYLQDDSAKQPEMRSKLDAFGKSMLNPADLAPQDRQVLQATMQEMFGTPMAPKVAALKDSSETSIAEKLQKELLLDEKTLAEGSRLYRQHCLHCHGLTGDGRGPTAFWVNPHPRDYRKGAYKFVSTTVPQGGEQRPRREDIIRTIRQGLEGTAMPAFNVLTDKESDEIASYVIHLGLRGEVEEDSISSMLKEKPGQRDWDPKERIGSGLRIYGDRWLKSQKELEPDPYPYTTDDEFKQSVQRGWDIFKKEVKDGGGDCLKCHTNYGRDSMFRFDDWATMTRPANLTAGIYRGGRRPIDLYWRVHNGIVGSGMVRSPQFRPSADDKGKKIDRLWDVVNFLQVLPYPQMRKQFDIRID